MSLRDPPENRSSDRLRSTDRLGAIRNPRAALLELLRQRMAPNGVGFISYNALPGGHFRGAIRSMLLRHTAAISNPAEKIRQARAFLAMLQLAPDAAGEGYRSLLQSEIGIAVGSSDFLLFHDDLAEVNQAYYFTEFAAEAGGHGLRFLAEANFADMSLDALPAPLAATLGSLAERDLILKEQYLDYIRCRGFRQTLLCHDGVAIDRTISLERMRPFRVAGLLERREVAAGSEFRSSAGSVLATSDAATSAQRSPRARVSIDAGMLLSSEPMPINVTISAAVGTDAPSSRALRATIGRIAPSPRPNSRVGPNTATAMRRRLKLSAGTAHCGARPCRAGPA